MNGLDGYLARLILDDRPALHHERDLLQYGHVGQRVGCDRYQVRMKTWRDPAQVLGTPDQIGRVGSCRSDRLGGVNPYLTM